MFSTHYSMIMLAINLGLLILLIIRWRIRKHREFIYEVCARDQRLASLDQRLANPEYLIRTELGTAKRYPYETKYLSSGVAMREFGGQYIGLLVESEMMSQRFFTDTASPIEIGSAKECAVTIRDDAIAPHQCLLFEQDGMLYARNLSQDHTMILERGDSYQKLGDTPVPISEGDRLMAGRSRITVTFDS